MKDSNKHKYGNAYGNTNSIKHKLDNTRKNKNNF
jgi:hypothetical protein